jgi:hypothetical protein
MAGGTRFRLWPKLWEGYTGPELVEISRPAGTVGPGPRDQSMYVANAVEGLPPLRVSRGPNRSSHWKIRPLRSATIIALCIGCTFPPGDWDGVRKNEVTGSNSYSKMVARYRQNLLAVHAVWPATVKA